MKKSCLAILLTFTALSLFAGEPQDSLSINSLQELVVSATRWNQRKDLQPVKVTSMSFEESNEYNLQTAADMLVLTGDVFVQKSQYAGGSPMIRGFATNRLLYSVDGVRMNNAIFRAGNIQNVISLDPFAISSTEVLFGPGSVSFGSDAIGGVMVFSTLRPRLSLTTSPEVFGSATFRMASASGEITGHAHAGVGWEKWAMLTSFSTTNFGDLKQGLHGPKDYIMPYVVIPAYVHEGEIKDQVVANEDTRLQSPSKYSQYNLMQKVRYAPARGWNMEYAFHLSETSEYARYDRHQRMRNGLPRYAEWNYGPQQWMMNHFNVSHTSPTIIYDSLKIDIAWQRFAESRISRELNKPLRETQLERVDAWSVNTDFIKTFHDKIDFSYGMEYVQNKVVSTAEALDLSTETVHDIPARYPHANWISLGLYAQAEWRAHRTLNIAAGLRYNHYIINSDFSKVGYKVPFEHLQSSNAGNVSGNIGINWRPSSAFLLRLNYARGFRAPNVDDMGKLFDSADGYVTVPNPSLQPEYADNFEVGFATHFSSWLRFDATAYYTRLGNAIVRRNYIFNGQSSMQYQGELCIVQALQNAAVSRVWGIQLSLQSRFARYFYVDAHFNWQRGFEELDDGQVSPSRHVAPMFGRAAIGFDNKKICIEAFTAFQGMRDAYDMPEEERTKTEIYAKDENGNAYSPAWVTINMRLSYAILKNLKLNATIENISDARYRPYSSGISAPGRNFTASLTYNL